MPQSHRVENLGATTFRLIGIAHKGRGTAVTEKDDDTEIDNDWFRGKRFRLAPGEKTQEHRHQYSVLVVQVSGGNSDVVENEMSTAEKTVSGNWSWHEARTGHVLRNIGTADIELLEVEIK